MLFQAFSISGILVLGGHHLWLCILCARALLLAILMDPSLRCCLSSPSMFFILSLATAFRLSLRMNFLVLPNALSNGLASFRGILSA